MMMVVPAITGKQRLYNGYPVTKTPTIKYPVRQYLDYGGWSADGTKKADGSISASGWSPIFKYQVRNYVDKTLTILYEMQGYTDKTLTAMYQVRNEVNREVTIKYPVRSAFSGRPKFTHTGKKRHRIFLVTKKRGIT